LHCFLPECTIRSWTSPYTTSYNSPTEKAFCLLRPIVRDASARCGAGRYAGMGVMATAGNSIFLESKDQGTMAAQVKSGGADQFQSISAGSPPDDKGLLFQRVKHSG
jgi:hypothetical protein